MSETTAERRRRCTAAAIERIMQARRLYGLGTTPETWNDPPAYSTKEGDRRAKDYYAMRKDDR